MNIQNRSNLTFFILLAILAAAAGVSSFLPQGNLGTQIPQSPIPAWQLAIAGAAITVVMYGVLGFIGLQLWRKMGFPEIWDASVTNRQRFLLPALVGAGAGVVLILCDLLFSSINGVGRLLHPPFPTSIVASISAGIGEEMLFRLFFVSFWTWLIGKVILRGRGLPWVYWVVSIASALAFAASHLPSLMMLLGVNDPGQFAPALLVEILLLNGLISLLAAYYFKKFGFFAPVGVHFWTDIVWHTLWGLF